MTKLAKNLFRLISLGSLTLTSCYQDMYGCPVDINENKTIKVQTEESIPIKGISVKLIRNIDTLQTILTENNGIASLKSQFYNDETYSVLVEDIDGEENIGKFETQEVNLSESDTTNIIMQK